MEKIVQTLDSTQEQRPIINVFIVCDSVSISDILNDLVSMEMGTTEVKDLSDIVKSAKALDSSKVVKKLGPAKKGRRPRDYTTAELKILLDKSFSAKEASELLGISKQSVYYKRKALKEDGIASAKTHGFSPYGIKILMDTSITTGDCARLLNKSYSSVYMKRRKLLGPKFTKLIHS